MQRPLDQRTIRALTQIVDFAGAGAQLVDRGPDAYVHDPMLRLACEAIMRRFDDAVSQLDELFLAAHPSIDWAGLTMTRNLGRGPGGTYDDYWEFLETCLPVEIRKVKRILDEWWSRPLPASLGSEVKAHPLAVSAPHHLDKGTGSAPINDDDFRRVVERLNDWAESATAPGDEGPIDVVYPSGRLVRIVLSAADLSDMLVVSGTIDSALLSVMDSLRKLPDDTPYLVYSNNYILVPSGEPILPIRVMPRGARPPRVSDDLEGPR